MWRIRSKSDLNSVGVNSDTLVFASEEDATAGRAQAPTIIPHRRRNSRARAAELRDAPGWGVAGKPFIETEDLHDLYVAKRDAVPMESLPNKKNDD
jgi:hypothetical protein